MKKDTIRRSVTIPSPLDNRISLMSDEYSFKVKNDLIVELLELGIIKFSEDESNKKLIYTLINRIDNLLNKLESK